MNNAWEMFGSATVDISGKADKVQNATSGNFASLDSNGNLSDSGHSFSEINQELTSVKSDLNKSAQIKESDAELVDLDISDPEGNVILRLEDGHIKTKNFDSSNIEIEDVEEIKDDISALENIVSKSLSTKNSSATGVDLDVSDNAGNVIVRIQSGHIQTKNFSSSEVIQSISEIESELFPDAKTVVTVDTTDEVVWTSSNSNIVTISDGVLIPVGIGTCTITATCGSYSATATVTVTMKVSLDLLLREGSSADSTHVVYVTNASTTYFYLIGKGDQATQYRIYDATTPADSKPVIKLPLNTGRIKISVSNAMIFYNSAFSVLFWFKDESSGWSSYPDAAYYISNETGYNIHSETAKVFSVPTGVNAISFKSRFASDQNSVEAALTALTSAGFEIEFLPAA